MSFTLKKGKTKIVHLPVTVSTEFTENTLVAWASGYIAPASSTTAATALVGVIKKSIASTDDDYATARLVPVEVPIEANVVWEADVTSGLVAADRGLFQDLTSAGVVNRAASTYDAVRCVGVTSTTKGDFVLNITA